MIDLKSLNLNYLQRDIYADMLKWKAGLKNKKTTLEVQGARQVGKSFIVNRFAEDNFKRVYRIDLFDEQDNGRFAIADQQNLGYKQIIELFFPDFVDDEDSIILIDEVQESKRAYNMIKPVALGLRAHMIVTGSFLGHVLQRGYFEVGAERTVLTLRSLSFAEFLGLFNAREKYEKIDLFGCSLPDDYEQIKRYYQLYLRVGGYPEVIKKSLLNDSFAEADSELERIVSIFCKDSERYFDDILDVDILQPMISRISDFLLRDNRGKIRFRDELSKLDYGRVSTQQNILRCLAWLEKSHLISPCGKYIELDATASDEKARYYFEDAGIAYYMLNQAETIAQTNKIGRYTENFVFRCISEQKTFRGSKPYFATHGDLELDFFAFISDIRKVHKIAVEVKTSNQRGKSASTLLKDGKLDYLIYAKGDSYGGRAGNIITIPVYLFGRFHIDEIIAPMKNETVSDILQ